MYRFFSALKRYSHESWFCCIACLAATPLFPEYISFILVFIAFSLALRDSRHRLSFSYLRSTWTLPCLAAWIGFMILSTIYSGAPLFTLSIAGMWIALTLGLISLLLVLNTPSRLHIFLLGLAVAAGITGMIATLQYFLISIFRLDASPRFWDFLDLFLYKFLPFDLALTRGGSRPTSTFNNPNIFCEYLTMVVPFILYGVWQEKRPLFKAIFGFSFCFTVLGIAFSFSRGGYMVLLIITTIFFLSKPKRIPWFVAGLLLIILFSPNSVVDRFLSIDDIDLSTMGRFRAWDICLQSFRTHPLLGLGVGTANTEALLLENGLKNLPHAHNLYIELLTEGGLIFLGIFILLGLRLAHLCLRMLRSPKTNPLGIATLAFGIGFAAYGLVEYPLLTPKLVVQFLLIVGMLEAFSKMFRLYENRSA